MKTTGQSEELRGATAQEEQHSDPEEEQIASSLEEEEAKEQETSVVAESPATDDPSASETAKADDAVAPEATPRKRRKKKAEVPFDEKAASPHPSYWPIVLAFSLCVMFLGVAWNPIMMGIGVVLVITSLIGWSLERR